MMERSRFEEKKNILHNIIKDVTNIFRSKKLRKETNDTAIKYIRNLLEHEEKNYFKPVKVNNFWNNNYVEYESNSDKNKTLSVKKIS